MNATMKKFGYPTTLIKEYARWVLLVRPQQVTLGSLVLICRDGVTAFSQISDESFAEIPLIIRELENNLHRAFSYQKINYLMLMMVDPEVHFHVFPRYEHEKNFLNQQFSDHGWPGPPDLKKFNTTSEQLIGEIQNFLRSNWISQNETR